MKIRVHPVTLSAIENRRQVPSVAGRARLCEFFAVPEEQLFGNDGLAI
jgi:transcriptional regulator with XRE-family HTH domain